MLSFKEFCEKVLSNDVICIVDDIMHGYPKYESVPAYKFLLEKDNPERPFWADKVLNKEVDRFTYGESTSDYRHMHLIVKLK